MSSLNLVPNPTVMAIQAGIFFANTIVVKKLFLDPYLGVYSRRIQLTKGNQDLAEKLDADNIKVIDTIQVRVQSAAEEGRKVRDDLLASARTKRDEIVDTASNDARKTIEALRKELTAEVELQRTKIPGLVTDLTRQLLDKLVPA